MTIAKRKPKNKGGFSMKLQEFHINKYSWVTQPKEKWNVVTFVSYFCIKYKETYSIEYRFSRWAGNPALTKEGKDFSRILKEYAELGLSKESAKTKLYNYINWAFGYKAKRGTNINSTGLLSNHVFFNEFEKAYLKYLNKVKRSVSIDSLKDWSKDNAPSILENYSLETANDLLFIQKMLELSDMEDSDESKLVKKAKEEGLI